MPRTMDELMIAILKIVPNATFEEDGEGQIVINTGLMTDGEDKLYPHEVQQDGA